jgi:hypothetical protein
MMKEFKMTTPEQTYQQLILDGIQICIRSHKSILGYFLPLPAKDANPYL